VTNASLPARTATCSCCTEPAVISLKERNLQLCGNHFREDLETRVSRSIRENAMIHDGDRIAVALSGGKDSTALLMLLDNVVKEYRGVSLVAITIDEGIAGYRDDTVNSAVRLAADLGIEHHIVSFPDLFGGSLDTFLRGKEARACTICGILRKKALATAAQDAGAVRLATGHNLNDEAQSVLMNVLRGDLPRLIRDSGKETGLFIPRIKPLQDISEKEIAVYLMVRDRWSDLPECPYTRFALRAEVRTMLSGLEYKYPGTMQKLIRSSKILSANLKKSEVQGPLQRCKTCGDPCSGEICQVCSLLPSLGR
jgi:uncharacterized protein (TIGR00269 family)